MLRPVAHGLPVAPHFCSVQLKGGGDKIKKHSVSSVCLHENNSPRAGLHSVFISQLRMSSTLLYFRLGWFVIVFPLKLQIWMLALDSETGIV